MRPAAGITAIDVVPLQRRSLFPREDFPESEVLLWPDFLRQADLVPREKLETELITVIGVGAIGRQVVLQLAGIPKSSPNK